MATIAAIIPAYNSAQTIARSLGSVAAQVRAPDELLIVDDGSTDDTATLAARLAPHARIIRQENRGAAAARNAGVRATSCDFIAMLDSDDAWLPDALSVLCAALEKSLDAVLAYGRYVVEDDRGRTRVTRMERAPTRSEMMYQPTQIIPSAALLRRSTFVACGGFDESFRHCGGEDWYLWLLMSEHGQFVYDQSIVARHGTLSPQAAALKYDPGNRHFLRLVRKRYGADADLLIRGTRNYLAGSALAAAISAWNSHEPRIAIALVFSALCYRPGLLFDRELRARVLRKPGVSRIRRLLGLRTDSPDR